MYTPPRTVGYPCRAHPIAASHRKPLDRGHHESPQRKPHGRANVPTQYPSEIFRQEVSECSIDSPAEPTSSDTWSQRLESTQIGGARRSTVSRRKALQSVNTKLFGARRFTSARTSTQSAAQRLSTNLIPPTVSDDFLRISLPLGSEIASWPFTPPDPATPSDLRIDHRTVGLKPITTHPCPGHLAL